MRDDTTGTEITKAIAHGVELEALRARIRQQAAIIGAQAEEIKRLKIDPDPKEVKRLKREIEKLKETIRPMQARLEAHNAAQKPQPAPQQKGMKMLRAWYPETYAVK